MEGFLFFPEYEEAGSQASGLSAPARRLFCVLSLTGNHMILIKILLPQDKQPSASWWQRWKARYAQLGPESGWSAGCNHCLTVSCTLYCYSLYHCTMYYCTMYLWSIYHSALYHYIAYHWSMYHWTLHHWTLYPCTMYYFTLYHCTLYILTMYHCTL